MSTAKTITAALILSAAVFLLLPYQTWETHSEVWIPSSKTLSNPGSTDHLTKYGQGEELLAAVNHTQLPIHADRRFRSDAIYISATAPESLDLLETETQNQLQLNLQKKRELAQKPSTLGEWKHKDALDIATPTQFIRLGPLTHNHTNWGLILALSLAPITALGILKFHQWKWAIKYRAVILSCLALTTALWAFSPTPEKTKTFNLTIQSNALETGKPVSYADVFSNNLLKSHLGEILTQILQAEGYPFKFKIPDNINAPLTTQYLQTNLLPITTSAPIPHVRELAASLTNLIKTPTWKQMEEEKSHCAEILPTIQTPFQTERRDALQQIANRKKP